MTVQIRTLASIVAGHSKVICQAALILVAIGGLAQAGTPLPVLAVAPPLGAPEIDAGSAASALSLLVGGALLLKEKFTSRKTDR